MDKQKMISDTPLAKGRFLVVNVIFLTIMILQAGAGKMRAGDQASKAIAAVKQLATAGKIPKDTIIRLMVQEGNINNFWGKNFELKDLWEKETPDKELAFLYSMWITDPEISTRSISVVSGIAAPYRMNHSKDPRLLAIYTQQVLDNLEKHTNIVIPAGTGLPGNFEYIFTLNVYLHQAARGKLTADS